MIVFSICLSVLSVVLARAPAANDASYKGQFCTDPRTMRNHAAYTEWADAYSCTRHRCQPGGRNLAIYTVGCKRVEAPESAIECEEVVEDTNMQFPYCCTRLRCLVVVRGEVWTRVLGQPWETLPAAPWSHMYKMKKPPPADGFAPKQGEGPVYELQPPTDTEDEPNLRAKKNTEPPPSAPILPAAPDIVLALSTDTDKDLTAKNNEEPKDGRRFTRQKGVSARKQQSASGAFSLQDLITDVEPHPHEIMNEEFEEQETRREQGGEPSHEEANVNIEEKAGLKITSAEEQVEERREHTRHREQEASTHLPDVFDHEVGQLLEETVDVFIHGPLQPKEHQGVPPIEASQLKQQPKAETTDEGGPEQNMQALVNAIGSRMKDIESVVAKMTDRASKPVADDHADDGSAEKVTLRSIDWAAGRRPHHEKDGDKAKKPNPDGEHYKRFPGRGKSKYLHNGDATDVPLLAENSHSNGYYSDASNIVQRAPPKEPGPAATYMAPVENRKKASPEDSGERKHKKKAHKKKKSKGHHRSHHEHERGKDDVKRKRFNKVISAEMDKNAVSLEDDKEFPFGNKS